MESNVLAWFAEYRVNVLLTVAIVAIYLIFRAITGPRIRSFAEQGRLKNDAVSKAIYTLNILLIIGVVSTSLVVWGFDFKGLLTLSASILAVTGVAMFASWSLLSNVTAFFVLLAHQSFRRGNFVRVIDLDNYIEGYISEINLFNTKLISESREVMIYPNNLLLSKPTIINPRNKLDGVGKIVAPVKELAEKNNEAIKD